MVRVTRLAGLQGASFAVIAVALSGCISTGLIPGMSNKTPTTAGEIAMSARPERKVDGSSTISDLASRHSVIPASSTYDRIARAVLAADAGASRAELRVKRLTAEARSKNWLPALGPSVSLTSLGDVVTSILLEATIFNFGRQQAEREYAVADVEVAAVNLASEANARVAEALLLYIDAEAARSRAAVASAAMGRLTEFDRIMGLRVQGGVSNMSEQTVLQQKLIEMQASLQSDNDRAALASAELDALAAARVSGSAGLTQLPASMPSVTPLAVHKAEAEKERTVAELKVARAGLLPGLSVNKDLSRGGGIGATIDTANGIGLGTGASMEAIGAGADAAAARVVKAGQDSERRRVALQMEISNLERQEAAQAEVVRQTKANLVRFEAQYKAGVRPLMDLVSQHESLAEMERDMVDMRHERARARVKIAQDLGLLADGAGI